MIPYGTTILCPTNHTYFNLNGGDVRKLKLQINSDKIVNRKEEGLVTSGTHSVIGTPADFTKMRTIMEAMTMELILKEHLKDLMKYMYCLRM